MWGDTWGYSKMSEPFKHDELYLKQYFLKLANEFYSKATTNASIENQLAAAVLYMNLADYVAEYLVRGLTEMVKEAVRSYYLGEISFNPPKKQKFNIEKSIIVLNRYDFPKKEEIMVELEKVNKARNKVAHEMLKVRGKDLNLIDKATIDLHDHTEALVILIDEIDPKLPPVNLKDIASNKTIPNK